MQGWVDTPNNLLRITKTLSREEIMIRTCCPAKEDKANTVTRPVNCSSGDRAPTVIRIAVRRVITMAALFLSFCVLFFSSDSFGVFGSAMTGGGEYSCGLGHVRVPEWTTSMFLTAGSE